MIPIFIGLRVDEMVDLAVGVFRIGDSGLSKDGLDLVFLFLQ